LENVMENIIETRLTDLEIRTTHQEAALEEMNGVLLAQHTLIDRLRDDIKRLRRQLQDVSAGGGGEPGNEPPPPHY
jgi:SlyX protein